MNHEAAALAATREALTLADRGLEELRAAFGEAAFAEMASTALALRNQLRRDLDRQLGLPDAPSGRGMLDGAPSAEVDQDSAGLEQPMPEVPAEQTAGMLLRQARILPPTSTQLAGTGASGRPDG